jgi:hypothetical protein
VAKFGRVISNTARPDVGSDIENEDEHLADPKDPETELLR